MRTAVATKRALTALAGEYPYFVHKWTKQRRHYSSTDLTLPDTASVRGAWPDWNKRVIGLGGTRTPTVETFCLVARVTRELIKSDVIIISGGVPGVDLAGHLAAIDDDMGATVAVLANPVDMGLRGHEWHNSFVEAQLLRRGIFLSEYQAPTEVFSGEYCERLLARDRIISGLCDLFIAFECSEDSATVDTVHRAILQKKRVICVESIAKSARRGIDQIRNDYSVPVLSERHRSATEIASKIIEEVATAGAI